MSKNPKNRWKLIKLANIDRESLHIFWTIWGISMKFSGKMWLIIILKITKNQGFTLSLEDAFFIKSQERMGGWVKLTPSSRFRVKMKFISGVTSPSWPGKSVNPNFRQYQSRRNSNKFNCCLEIQSKIAARISICTLNSSK